MCAVTCEKWYNILMVERILVGSCLVFLLLVEFSPAVTIGVFLLLGVFAVVRKPYLELRHNVRFACNTLICIAIQGIYLGYKKASFHDQNKQPLWLMMPVVVCVLLILCIIYNAAALVHDICSRRSAKSNEEESQKEEEEIANELGKEMMNMSLTTNPLIDTKRSGLSPEQLVRIEERNNKEELDKIR